MTTYRGADIFDGYDLLNHHVLEVQGGRILRIAHQDALPPAPDDIHLTGTLAPGFVDLQVNGGGGRFLDQCLGTHDPAIMAEAHQRLGTSAMLPTLITNTPAITAQAITRIRRFIADFGQTIHGLHLEGPHLSQAQKGAHDPALIRPMTSADLDALCQAAQDLPALMVTLAPESVTPAQITALREAGALVSLGHSDADYDTCRAAFDAGATLVTHLFNAMSGLHHRNPGLVGAAFDTGHVSAGLIADGHHVHPAAIRTALRAKTGPGSVFLVSDAMSCAGTDARSFTLNGRTVGRQNGTLRLEDGTLAGADISLLDAVRVMIEAARTPPVDALAMATRIPADLIGLTAQGRLAPDMTTPIQHITSDWRHTSWIVPPA